MSGDVHPVGTPWWRHRLQDAIAIDEQIASDREQQIEHVHLFEFLLNNSHTALRGCTICGMTSRRLDGWYCRDNCDWHG